MPRHAHPPTLQSRRERTRDLQTAEAGERAGPQLRARHAGARGAARPSHPDGARADLDPDGDRRQGGRDQGDDPGGDAAPQGARSRGRRARAAPSTCSWRSTPRGKRMPTGRGCRGRSARRCTSAPPSSSPARGARRSSPRRCSNQSKTAHQAEIDAAARADRLLALQRRVHAPDLLGAARLVARRLEPDGVSAARRLRLRGQPVQLHRDRRQPQRLARADGQHRRLEAGLDRGAVGSLHAAAPAGGRAPGWGDQPRLRLGRDDRRRGSREPRARGIHFTGSTPVFQSMWKTVGQNIANYRNYPRIVGETGGKDFIIAHSSADVDEVATAIVRGSLRVPGTEVLGRLARLRAEEHVAGAEGPPRRRRSRSCGWATSPTSRTSWAR